ncbi:MAG: ABC transporter permease subunit [Alphaproteobacteria bacterium]|nr:ABC transporter permease subunit [Alphaproteobacteria bacterium]
MPEWFSNLSNFDPVFALEYITNGKHLAWYLSLRFTVGAAILGAAVALFLGLGAATLRRARLAPVRWVAAGYANIVRGVPDVLFFLFFPLAFEQAVEWFWSRAVCSPEALAGARWPPCPEANWFLTSSQSMIMAGVSLGIVYGAFASNVIHGAMNAVPRGQLEAARAYGMSAGQVMWRVHVRQMWIYALPGLSNVWMLLLKATSLLSLLQIADIVQWADRLGAPNFMARVGLVHPDWRWRYYLVLFILYILATMASERGFAYLRKKAGHGMIDERVAT